MESAGSIFAQYQAVTLRLLQEHEREGSPDTTLILGLKLTFWPMVEHTDIITMGTDPYINGPEIFSVF